ncbi:MAG: DUF1365 domain-containing protein [Pseudomonadota bacterium]
MTAHPVSGDTQTGREAHAPPKAPPPPACLYTGHVMHMRLRPKRHQFRYRVWSLMVDIDRLAEMDAQSRLMRLGRFGLVSFALADHGPRDGSPLRPWVEARLAEAGRPPPFRIALLSMPRLLGYVFNPLSVYFCRDATGALESVVYEVKNTFGDQIAYALPCQPDHDGRTRHAHRKDMFVSPFIAMDETYCFTITDPAERLAIRIRQGDAQGDTMIATQTAHALPFSDRMLAGLLLRHPMLNLKVIAAIHWQALRLFLKGVRFLGHPGPDRVFRPPASAKAHPRNMPSHKGLARQSNHG